MAEMGDHLAPVKVIDRSGAKSLDCGDLNQDHPLLGLDAAAEFEKGFLSWTIPLSGLLCCC